MNKKYSPSPVKMQPMMNKKVKKNKKQQISQLIEKQKQENKLALKKIPKMDQNEFEVKQKKQK
jgi:hypothetical protein